LQQRLDVNDSVYASAKEADEKPTKWREECPKDEQQYRIAMMALWGQIDLGKLLWSIHSASIKYPNTPVVDSSM
jgi:hypothetical protein